MKVFSLLITAAANKKVCLEYQTKNYQLTSVFGL